MSSPTDAAMRISVVISTYNRPTDLRNALDSLAKQSLMPHEVLVVDDGDSAVAEGVVESLQGAFRERGCMLAHLRNTGVKSLTVARNLGVDRTHGDVVMFIDDDVVLDREYVKYITGVYSSRPGAVAVQGFHGGDLDPSFTGRLGNAIDRAFMNWFYGKDSCRVMPSFYPTYPHEVTRVIQCEWLSGCNMSYRREVFAEQRFDEKLRRYSPGEDLDFSYRLWKRHPGSLFLVPEAKLEHRYAKSSRTPKRNLVLVQTVYRDYLASKNMGNSFRHKLAFSWSTLGKMVTSLMRNVKAQATGRLNEPCFTELKYLLEGWVLSRRHRDDIRAGHLEFLDMYLEY
jgi:GT2 family glycosyltransferase